MKMKIILLVCLCTVAYAYEGVDDSIDVNAVFKDPVQAHEHINCYLEEGPCTEQMEAYRKLINEGVRELCAKCSPIQKEKVQQVIKIILTDYPHEALRLQAKYDPESIIYNMNKSK